MAEKPAAAIVAGVALGDLTAMTASMLGMGAILATSATIFTVLRWIGGAYLVYLGVKLWRAPIHATDIDDAAKTNSLRMLGHAYAVTALNPKSIVFFVAFVPQFVNAARPFLPQVVTLEATFVILATMNAAMFAVLAAAARQKLREARIQRVINRTGGSLLIGAGILSVGWRKASA